MDEIVPPNSAHAGRAKTISAKASANSGLLHFRLIQLIEYAPVKIPAEIHERQFTIQILCPPSGKHSPSTRCTSYWELG
jgi:hypothetical protein